MPCITSFIEHQLNILPAACKPSRIAEWRRQVPSRVRFYYRRRRRTAQKRRASDIAFSDESAEGDVDICGP